MNINTVDRFLQKLNNKHAFINSRSVVNSSHAHTHTHKKSELPETNHKLPETNDELPETNDELPGTSNYLPSIDWTIFHSICSQAECWRTPFSLGQVLGATPTSTRTRTGHWGLDEVQTWRLWLPTSSATPWAWVIPAFAGHSWRPIIPTPPVWNCTRTMFRASRLCTVSSLCHNLY